LKADFEKYEIKEDPTEMKKASNPIKASSDLFNRYPAVTFGNISNLIYGPAATQRYGSKIVVKGGVVTCVGECETVGQLIDLEGGWVTPGLIATGTHLGLEEIEQELEHTSTGRVSHEIKAENGELPFIPSAAAGVTLGRENSKLLGIAD
jgi:imidazolonepropionase-like amidohydrolase